MIIKPRLLGPVAVLLNLSRRIAAENTCHEPAGSSTGGQFCPSSGGGSGSGGKAKSQPLAQGWKQMAPSTGEKNMYVHPFHGVIKEKASGNFVHTSPNGKQVGKGSYTPGQGNAAKQYMQDYNKKLGMEPIKIQNPISPPKQNVTPTSELKTDSIAPKDMHNTLTDAGYQHKWSGTSNAMYKNTGTEQQVLVSPNGNFIHYDKDGNSTDSGKGLSDLQHSLNEAKTKGASDTKSGEVPYPDPSATGGKPEDHVDLLSGHKYTVQEKNAVSDYKGSSSYINDHALGLIKEGQQKLSDSVKHIDNAMAKGRTNKDLVVFRGLAGSYAMQLNSKIAPGFTFHPHYFQETSTAQSIAHHSFTGSGNSGLVLKINVQKGTPAIPTTALTDSHTGEKGIIFSRAAYYKVNKVYTSQGMKYADVDLIHPGITIQSSHMDDDYVDLVAAAAKLGFTGEQLDQALTTMKDAVGRDVTPVKFRLLRIQLDNVRKQA